MTQDHARKVNLAEFAHDSPGYLRHHDDQPSGAEARLLARSSGTHPRASGAAAPVRPPGQALGYPTEHALEHPHERTRKS